MATADEWRQIRDAIRASEDLERSPHVPKLYRLAVEDGSRELARRWSYSNEESIDLIHNVLAERWAELLAADSPRALFFVVLVRRAIDRHRRRKREAPLDETAPGRLASTAGDAAAHGSQLQEVLEHLDAALSPRDSRVFVARTLYGEPSRAVAEAEGLSIANVDKIVSRTRAMLKRHFDADSE
jgi:RNA polymerase sigma factor (sigma-70 family)